MTPGSLFPAVEDSPPPLGALAAPFTALRTQGRAAKRDGFGSIQQLSKHDLDPTRKCIDTVLLRRRSEFPHFTLFYLKFFGPMVVLAARAIFH